MQPAENMVYNKADSIVEIRTADADRTSVLQKIAALQSSIPESSDDRKMLILGACNDLLGKSEKAKFPLRPHVIEEIKRIPQEHLARYLYYRYRYEVNPFSQIVDSYPPCVQIEPTSICNYRCVFCYQTDQSFTGKSNGHMGSMSLDVFRNIVDQIEGEVEAVTLASRGEPLLAPKIEEMLEYISGKFLALKINTNASILTEKLSHAILKAEPQTLVFSADAASEPRYSQLRVKGNLDRVLANVELFEKIKVKHYPNSQIITRVSGVRYTQEQDIDSMEGFWGRFVDQVAFVDYNPWENAYESPCNKISQACSDLWRRIFVWWDGRVNPCDVDYKSELSIGNILEDGLSELWTGEGLHELRLKHLSDKRKTLRPCSGCVVV